jgi:phytoene desaturase
MTKIAEALHRMSAENRTKFLMNEEARKIRVRNGRAVSVVTDRREIKEDMVIVNADYPHSELDLLDREHRTYDSKYWESRKLAPSAFVAYIGVGKKVKTMLHHTLFLDRDWASGFDEIFEAENPKWPTSPSYYVNIPSKTDSGLAPKGCDTLFILAPLAPGLRDTHELRERFLDKILDNIEKTTGEKIRKHIKTKRIFAVNDFRKDYNAYRGTALSIVHTLRQTALWRPKHKSRKVRNLLYTGQYTHPGIGVPMTLISSEIVADIIEKQGEKPG